MGTTFGNVDKYTNYDTLYDWHMIACLKGMHLHELIFKAAREKHEWYWMKEVIETDIKVTHVLEENANLPLFAIAVIGEHSNLQTTY